MYIEKDMKITLGNTEQIDVVHTGIKCSEDDIHLEFLLNYHCLEILKEYINNEDEDATFTMQLCESEVSCTIYFKKQQIRWKSSFYNYIKQWKIDIFGKFIS